MVELDYFLYDKKSFSNGFPKSKALIYCHMKQELSRMQEIKELRYVIKKGGEDYIKDGAYYCYCAYVLRISRYTDFLSPMLTNTGVFLHGLKLSGESRS